MKSYASLTNGVNSKTNNDNAIVIKKIDTICLSIKSFFISSAKIILTTSLNVKTILIFLAIKGLYSC